MKNNQSGEQKRKSQDRIIEIINEYANGSQQELCDQCGVSKSSISQYVNRTNAPGNITSAKIAGRYGLNPLWVMGFDVPKIIKTDADKFKTFSEVWNNSEHTSSHKISEKEFNVIKKIRELDKFGKKAITAVLDIEYERCTNTATTNVKVEKTKVTPFIENDNVAARNSKKD